MTTRTKYGSKLRTNAVNFFQKNIPLNHVKLPNIDVNNQDMFAAPYIYGVNIHNPLNRLHLEFEIQEIDRNIISDDQFIQSSKTFISEIGGLEQQTLTRTGYIVGTTRYMAPEQIQGQEVDGRCDLYALGVMAYTMLTGREPFAADSPTAVVLKHLNDPPPDIRQDLPEIDGTWVNLLGKLLAKQPEDRFEDAEALLEVAATLPS